MSSSKNDTSTAVLLGFGVLVLVLLSGGVAWALAGSGGSSGTATTLTPGSLLDSLLGRLLGKGAAGIAKV